jgi:hypothetical protein
VTTVWLIRISDGFVSWYHHGEVFRSEEVALETVQYIQESMYPADVYSVTIEEWTVV